MLKKSDLLHLSIQLKIMGVNDFRTARQAARYGSWRGSLPAQAQLIRLSVVALSEIDRNLLQRCLGRKPPRGKISSIATWDWSFTW